MAKKEKFYTRLTRNASGLGSYSSLWLAADHLMIVTSTGYTENYSRLLLRDIQAFFVVKTDRRLWWSLGWGALTLVNGIIAAMTYNNDDTPIASAIFFGLGLVMFIWNEALGSSCRVYVVTGVQTVSLPSLVRRRKARRALGRLQPLIDAAQADLLATPPVITAAPPPPFARESLPEAAEPVVAEPVANPENSGAMPETRPDASAP